MKVCLEQMGENIRIARVFRGYSQEGLANKMGKSQNWLQRVEKGEVDMNISQSQNKGLDKIEMIIEKLNYTLVLLERKL